MALTRPSAMSGAKAANSRGSRRREFEAQARLNYVDEADFLRMRPVSHEPIQTSKATMIATMMRKPRSPSAARGSPSSGDGASAATRKMVIAAAAPHHHGRRTYDIAAPITIGKTTTASNSPTSAIRASDGIRASRERELEAGGLN